MDGEVTRSWCCVIVVAPVGARRPRRVTRCARLAHLSPSSIVFVVENRPPTDLPQIRVLVFLNADLTAVLTSIAILNIECGNNFFAAIVNFFCRY